MAEVLFIEKDTAVKLIARCNDRSGGLLDLTSCTAKMVYKIGRNAEQTVNMVVDELLSKVSYQWGVNELLNGFFKGRVQIFNSLGKRVSSLNRITLNIQKVLI